MSCVAEVVKPKQPVLKQRMPEQQPQEDVEITVEEEVEVEEVAVASKVEEPVASKVEEQPPVEEQAPVAVAIPFALVDVETASVVSDVESTRSFASLSSFNSSRPSSPSVNLLGVSTLPPRSRLNTIPPSTAPIHTPYRRSISATSPLASFAASRALRTTPLTISAPLASSFYQHRSPIPSPLDPPSFPFPSQNQLQSPPSSPRISIASEDSALRTPLGGNWELEEEGVSGLNLGRERVVSNGSGRRVTVGSIDRLPGIYESVGISGQGMGRRTSDAGRGYDYYPLSPPSAQSYYSPTSPQHQYASSSSILFGSNSCRPQLQSPPSPYYEPSPASYSYPPPHQYVHQHARHPPVEGYQQQQQHQHPRFASTSRGGGGYASQVRRVQSSGNLIGRKASQGW
ncbi:hypothetical protein BDY24DRAFT_24965 [Mrakia frigida]|uniref:uncharacterized protein n=1 Tax=Mrakia frigida TaxID=29902 RepID=UPI003FCC01F1